MDSHIQLIGSIVIGSLLLLGLMRFHANVVDASYEKSMQLMAPHTAASFLEIVEHDFRRIGSGLASPASAITDTFEITFLGDLDDDGVVDVVRYYTSDPYAAGTTENPNDVILYREVNGVNTIASPAGVTEFRVTLLDEFGNKVTDMMNVRMLDVAITVESLFPYDQKYEIAFWEKRIAPQNLFRNTVTDF